MGSVTNYALSWDANLKTIQQCQLEAQRETDGMASTEYSYRVSRVLSRAPGEMDGVVSRERVRCVPTLPDYRSEYARTM